VFAFVPGHPKYLRTPEDDVLQIEGLPYVDIAYNEDVEYYWGPSDCKIIEPQQLEVNEARTQAMKHRRIALVKFLVDSNLIDPVEVDKMLSENVGPVVRVKGRPADSVTTLQPHIPPDLVQWVEQIRMDVRETLGFGRHQMGDLSTGRRTATETSAVQMAHEIRIDERRDMVGDALGGIVRKVNQVIFSRWDEQHITQVVGYDGAKYWVKYNKEAIAGEYNIKVDVESLNPSTKAVKKRDLIELIGALAKHPQANINYLLKQLVRQYDWIDAMAVLPEAKETANGQPMGVDQYAQQQQGLLNNPSQLGARVRQTQQNAGRRM